MLIVSSGCAVQVRSTEDVLSLGQELPVKVMGHDSRGHLQISHKALLPPPDKAEGDGAADNTSDDSSAPAKRPYQAVNARFRQSDRGSRDFRQQKARVPQSVS